MNRQIVSEQQKLEYLFGQISKIEDDEMKAQWAKYLCILTSAFVENYLRIWFSNYAKQKSSR